MSAGGWFGFAQNFAMIGGICWIMAGVMDYLYNFVMINAHSQDAINTISWIRLGFIAIPILYILLALLNHIVVANSEQNQEV